MKRGPSFVEPMKAKLVEGLPSGDWSFEIKFDGFRALAIKDGSKVQLLSRNEKDLGGSFPSVLTAIASLRPKQAVIDGEIVAVDEGGKSSFQLLQAYGIGEKKPPIVFYVFDVLYLDGRDLKNDPLHERKSILEANLAGAPPQIKLSQSIEGNVNELLARARELGLEGLIGKRKKSVYESGRRSGAWIKLKVSNEQEFVIGGYTEPQGGRTHFGALLVGYHEGGKFMFAGKVGTGFSEASLRELYGKFKGLQISDCPFANLPEPRGSRYSPGLTASAMRRCNWVKPSLVCQIRFTEWTRDGKLRHPVFLGLRDDKSANAVIRERPESPKKTTRAKQHKR